MRAGASFEKISSSDENHMTNWKMSMEEVQPCSPMTGDASDGPL